MKKFVAIMVIVVLSLSVTACYADALKNAVDEFSSHIYPSCGIVVEVNYEEDYIVIEDFYGNAWIFEGVEDWIEGDIVAVIMDDNGTEQIEDDIIIDIRYCGTMED